MSLPALPPSACLSVIGRGEWPVLPVLPPHLPPISSSASPEAAVCISCVFVLFPRESQCFLYIFFPPLCLSGSLCLCHLRLLAPPPASTSWLLSGSSRYSLTTENCFAPDRGSCGSHQSNRDPHRPAAIWPQIRICFLNHFLDFFFIFFFRLCRRQRCVTSSF